MDFRIDKDSMGEIKVPKNAYYGPQTQRSLENFPIGQDLMPMEVIKALVLVKKACAITNQSLGKLSQEKAHLIIKAADEILEGKYQDQFVLKVWQTGSGTQTNMNVNEVIASIANEMANMPLGSKIPIHPNDHVNMSQSTNDAFPTAMHIAAVFSIHNRLLLKLKSLEQTFLAKEHDFKDVIKMGRTHLQDATPVTLGQEMGSYAYQLSLAGKAIRDSLPFLYELALGGTAVGTGLNSHPHYAPMVADTIKGLTGLPFVTSPNKFAALSSNDPCALLSGALNMLAIALMKIANDIRWMASGPRGGLNEIFIAENEPGSSIMPGKVNPTQCEALTQISCQVMGNHVAISIAASQGNFELNVFKPVIIKNLLSSIELLSDGMDSFNCRCAKTIVPNLPHLKELCGRSLMLVTALSPYIGYDKAAHVAKKALEENKTLKEVVLAENLMTEDEFLTRVKPEDMLYPKG